MHLDVKCETPESFQGSVPDCLQVPRCLLLTIACPTDKILRSTTKELRISDVVDFVLFFTVDCDWIRGRWRQAVYIVPFIRAEAIHMKYIVDLEGWRERQSVVHITDDFSDLNGPSCLGPSFADCWCILICFA